MIISTPKVKIAATHAVVTFVENAIRHGLLLQEKREICMKFKTCKGDLICIIEDDGVAY